jgi:hypothetical protein
MNAMAPKKFIATLDALLSDDKEGWDLDHIVKAPGYPSRPVVVVGLVHIGPSMMLTTMSVVV